ncbi:MAG: TIGR02678 family protein [Kiritimatiellae bacterium]|nr:TIGR02678 family protein [Kiritimatiellia bacterium]
MNPWEDDLHREPFREAVRALLRQPLLRASGKDAETFRLVRRHADGLRRWFIEGPAWPLLIESEFARLVKYPGRPGNPDHPALDTRRSLPFNRRRYTWLCLILSLLEKSERQTTLGDLAIEIERLGRGDPVLTETGMEPVFDRRDARMDLVSVVRLLIDQGVLLRIHGSEEGYIQDSGDVLYTLNRALLARLPAFRRSPNTLADSPPHERPGHLQDELGAIAPEARPRAIRTRLMRLLLDTPVVYYADLDPAERDYLQPQRTRLLDFLHAGTGLLPEIRAEGIALTDPETGLTDLRMPEEGTSGHAALLLADFYATHLRGPNAQSAIPYSRSEQHLRQCAKQHAHRWRRDTREPAGLRQLHRDVVHRLCALHLLRQTADDLHPLPAIARYRLTAEK